jgi:hypothetical protein
LEKALGSSKGRVVFKKQQAKFVLGKSLYKALVYTYKIKQIILNNL